MRTYQNTRTIFIHSGQARSQLGTIVATIPAELLVCPKELPNISPVFSSGFPAGLTFHQIYHKIVFFEPAKIIYTDFGGYKVSGMI